MKFSRFSGLLSLILAIFTLGACSGVEEPDWREQDYGYVQFKLYKEDSYNDTTAAVAQIDYLAKAKKVMVIMEQEGGNELRQTLTLGASDDAAAEWGLRSEKLMLVAGNYHVTSFTLYDVVDEELYKGGDAGSFTIVPGGYPEGYKGCCAER